MHNEWDKFLVMIEFAHNVSWQDFVQNTLFVLNTCQQHVGRYVTGIYIFLTFAISNSSLTLLYVRPKDSILGDLIVLKGKGELPTSWDSGVTRCSHLVSLDS